MIKILHLMRQRNEKSLNVSVLFTNKTLDDILFKKELDSLKKEGIITKLTYTLTREKPEGWTGKLGRIDRKMLEECIQAPSKDTFVYTCGPFGKTIRGYLTEIGHVYGKGFI